jgi:hypothetical protein
MVRLQTRRPSFNSSPRIRSAPQSRFCVAICLIKAMVSAATFGLWEEVFDLRFQYRRKSPGATASLVSGCTSDVSLLPRSNQPGQQDEEHAIGLGECWPFHLSL